MFISFQYIYLIHGNRSDNYAFVNILGPESQYGGFLGEAFRDGIGGIRQPASYQGTDCQSSQGSADESQTWRRG